MRVHRGQPNRYDESIYITTEKEGDYYVIRQGEDEIILRIRIAKEVMNRLNNYINKKEAKEKESLIAKLWSRIKWHN